MSVYSPSPEPPTSSPPGSPSPRRDLIPILHATHQVVLYNPTSHAVSIRAQEPGVVIGGGEIVPSKSSHGRALFCPYCDRPFDDMNGASVGAGTGPTRHHFTSSRAHNYFQLLEISNESSRPSTPFSQAHIHSSNSNVGTSASTHINGHGHGFVSSSSARHLGTGIASENMAEGYFSAFFREECRLGMGANGSVYLCQHVLHGNKLGRFAVKKIAVGQSQDYLVNALREVRLLETLHHPNIVTYHHSWLETCQFSTFGPPVPTLYVLMQWAEGGSLDDFIRMRLGIPVQSRVSFNLENGAAHVNDNDNDDTEDFYGNKSRSARIRAFRAAQARPEVRRAQRTDSQQADRNRAIHFLNAMEVKSIFNDVVSGLGFLHAKSILHLDLKPGNVLLTFDDSRMIPRAMLSDFGTYQDMLRPQRARTGITGTLEYTAPESLSIETRPTSKVDMWSLGMILHILLFFRLPYDHVEDSDISKLEREVLSYKGFKPSLEVTATCKRRGVPRAALIVLQELLAINPRARPSCEQILAALREGKMDPLNRDSTSDEERNSHSLVPVVSVSPQAQVQVQHEISSPPPPLAIRIQTRDSDSSSTSLSSDADSFDEHRLAGGGGNGERKHLLGLPAPPSLALPEPRSSKSQSRVGRAADWIETKFHAPLEWMREVQHGRVFKSSVLFLKIMSLSQLCRTAPSRPIVLCSVVVLAVLDLWTERLSTSAALGLVHIGILSLGRRRCCLY